MNDYKYGLTNNCTVVRLPSDETIVWNFISFPDLNLANYIYTTLRGEKMKLKIEMLLHKLDKFMYRYDRQVAWFLLGVTVASAYAIAYMVRGGGMP